MTSAPQAIADFISRSATRIPRPYGDALLAAARADERIVCLCADLRASTETDVFHEALPERFVDVGIAEANMIGIAGGLARSGKVPFVHTFAVFATRRCYDQIAVQVAYPRLPVKIVGFLPGLTTYLGVSHQAIDDVALMRALPNMTVIEPADAGQAAAAVRAALAVDGPVYLRMRRPEKPLVEVEQRPLVVGKAEILCEGGDALIVASGLMVAAALDAARTLAARGVEAAVVNAATLKPLDGDAVLHLLPRSGRVVTAENHSIVGGLGAAVAELLAESGRAATLRRVGVRDTFAEGASTPYLLRKYGLTADAIVEAVTAG